MSALSRIKRLFGREPATTWNPAPPHRRNTTERRWEAGDTDRLNRLHWSGVTGASINTDLATHLSKVRDRASHEAANNAFVEGVINTYSVDVVGQNGPSLQVQTDNKAYGQALEGLWRKWWANPDLNGQLAGPEMLALWMRGLWTSGEYLAQKVSVPKGDDSLPISLRLHAIDPRRLDTPSAGIADDVTLGIKRTATGKPIEYYVYESGLASGEYKTIPAKDIVHAFRVLEPSQARGVPWLAPVLQVIADLRDYDSQVLDAARAAADFAIWMVHEDPDGEFIKVNDTIDIERRTIKHAAPGWTPQTVDSHQPPVQYADYRTERLRELGRVASMPLMIVLLDASGHNYSSARFDAQKYDRGVHSVQGWTERATLNPLVDDVARLGSLVDTALRDIPADVRYHWTWPPAPHVDPTKEGKAATERLGNHTSTLQKECAAVGLDYEDVIAQLKHEKELLEAAGLDTALPEPGDDEDDDEEENDSNAKSKD